MPNMNQNINIEELVRSIPILASTGNTEALNRVLDLIDEMKAATPAEEQPAKVGKYLYARVLTTNDGVKHYHPVVVAKSYGCDITDPASYVMNAKDTILELQEDSASTSMKRMAECQGYTIQAVYVTNEVYAQLEEKLQELMTSVIEGTRGGAMAIAAALQALDNSITPETITQYCMQKVNGKPYVAGTAVNADGAIVDKAEYVDEKKTN